MVSERRFLIFTRRGPIEIHFKLSHYLSLALTIAVGLSSIIYYSIVGITSAIESLGAKVNTPNISFEEVEKLVNQGKMTLRYQN